MTITLTRKQIEKLVEIYSHFHEIETFTISLEEDSDMVSVNFSLCDVKSELKSQGKFDKPFKPAVYK